MKQIFIYISFIILFFACKSEPKEVTISAEPSAKARVAPHQNASEQFNLEKGAKIVILGVSSHKDKITIGGVAYNEPWYLVAKSDTTDQMQGWVYGGCISFPKDYIKPSFTGISEKDLVNKRIYYVPCFELFDDDGNPSCGTDCFIGSFDFVNEKECFYYSYCIGNGQHTFLAKYNIKGNVLKIETYPYYVDEEEKEDENGNSINLPPAVKKSENNEVIEFEIQNFGKDPVFTPISKDGYWGSIPTKMLGIEPNTKILQDMVLKANGR